MNPRKMACFIDVNVPNFLIRGSYGRTGFRGSEKSELGLEVSRVERDEGRLVWVGLLSGTKGTPELMFEGSPHIKKQHHSPCRISSHGV